MPRLALAALVALSAAGPARAQLDPEPKTPYLWRVVVKAAPHPLLSPAFRDQLRRDLAAALQPALGPLGTVEVVDLAAVPRDKWDALWQQFDDKGFPALDASRDLTGAKTHFLTLECRDGRYHLASRQHDGFSGLASPVVRTQTVRAPELVGRTAGLMLDRDFGPAGTVEPPGPGSRDEVKVTVRGGRLGPLDRVVKAGDVFAVSQVFRTNRPAPEPVRSATGKIIAPPPGSEPPPGLTANPRDFTLLRVTEVNKDGTLRCGVLTRYQNPFPKAGGAVGYRCLKLGTVEAPVAVRLVTSDPAYQNAVGLVRVQASDAGFGAAGDVLDPKDGGVFRSARPLAHVACVTASHGARTVQFPVPVLGPDPVGLPFEINPRLEEEAEYARRVLAASARVADARAAQAVCFEATAKLIEKGKNADALARARGGLEAAGAADKGLTDDLARLKDLPGSTPDGARLVAHVGQQLAALREFNAQLDKHVKTLDEVVRRENDKTIVAKELQAQELSARIAVLLGRGDLDEAVNAYDQLVTLLPDDPDVRAKREKLRAERVPKDEAHAKAREYLLKTWPGLSAAEYDESLKRLEAEVEVCRRHGDRYTLRKLLTVFGGALVKLNEYVGGLDPSAAKPLAAAKKAGEALAALETRITEFVTKE